MTNVIVVTQPERKVLVVTPQEIAPVVLQPASPTALIVAQRGPKGDSGDADPSYVASVALGGHRVLRLTGTESVDYAQPSVDGTKGIVGVSLHAATTGAPITVRREGHITDPSFMFTPGQSLFLTSNGFMTQILPSSGVIQRIGYAITATTMSLSIDPPIAI